MRQRTIQWVVLLGVFSILVIVATQIYWLKQLFNTNENQFNQSIKIALFTVAEQIIEYNQTTLANENPVSQRSSNYFVVNVNQEIDKEVLRYYLKTEFEKRGINLDYEYAIYDCSSDKMVYGEYVKANNGANSGAKTFNLPKHSAFTYYFGVYFPTKSSYIISKFTVWIFTSPVMLVVIIFFGYALFVILRQKRLSEQQKDFIDNMTHEFKTPISTISISADVLMKPEIVQKPERLLNYAVMIKNESMRLNNLVEKVLQMAKVEGSSFKYNYEYLDIHNTLSNIKDNLNERFNEENGNLSLDLQAQDYLCNVDRVHFTNTVYNLIDNALKYCKKTPNVCLGTYNEPQKLIIYVKDNGIGMEKSVQKKIFDKFYRAPTQNVHDVKGFGIGLNYVKSIILAHKGKISVESEPNVGSKFIIELPL